MKRKLALLLSSPLLGACFHALGTGGKEGKVVGWKKEEEEGFGVGERKEGKGREGKEGG